MAPLWFVFIALLGLANERVRVSDVPCKSVADCWLDANGKPIARPKAKRGRSFPRPDCGKNIVWLRNKLRCEDQVCVSEFIGDRC